MGVRRGPVPLGQVLPDLVNPMLDAAKVFDGKNAVNRMRAEGMTALRLLDGRVPSPVLHKLRLAVTLVDEVREELMTDTNLERETNDTGS